MIFYVSVVVAIRIFIYALCQGVHFLYTAAGSLIEAMEKYQEKKAFRFVFNSMSTLSGIINPKGNGADYYNYY